MRLGDLDALARAIKTECNPYGKPTIDFESGKKVLKIIDNAPTVDTTFKEVVAYECGQKSVEERPKGKWVEQDNGFGKLTHTCSNCGKRALEKLVWIDIIEEVQSNFCPNCGADMRGERMGFRLFISKTPEGYSNGMGFRKFYGYCDYKYAKDSFEYLYSVCGDEIKDSLIFPCDSIEELYDIITCFPYTDRYHLTAEQFRIFISKYIAGMQWWYNDEGTKETLTLYSFGELPDLYADECDKYIDWG